MSMKYDFTTILNREGTGAIAVSKIPFDNATIKEGFSKIWHIRYSAILISRMLIVNLL